MANAEISILGREAHTIESTRSTFSLQSLMWNSLLDLSIYLPQVIWERVHVLNPLIPWPIFFIVFNHIYHVAIYFLALYFTCSLLYLLHCIYYLNLTTTIISISSSSPHHHHHLHLHISNSSSPLIYFFLHCIIRIR